METFLRRNVMRRFWISDQCHYDPTWDILHNMLTQYYFSAYDTEAETIAALTRKEARAILREQDPNGDVQSLCWGA